MFFETEVKLMKVNFFHFLCKHHYKYKEKRKDMINLPLVDMNNLFKTSSRAWSKIFQHYFLLIATTANQLSLPTKETTTKNQKAKYNKENEELKYKYIDSIDYNTTHSITSNTLSTSNLQVLNDESLLHRIANQDQDENKSHNKKKKNSNNNKVYNMLKNQMQCTEQLL